MNILPSFKLTFEWMMTNVAKFIQYCRYVSNFNGTSSYAESLTRIIDLDAVDPSFKFTWWGDFDGGGTFFSQNISSTPTNKEFQLYTLGDFIIYLGGTARSLLDTPTVTANAGYGLLEVEYNHSLAEIYTRKDGVLLNTTVSIVIGAAREPTAKFKYMARSNNSVDSEGFLKAGRLKNVIIEHNGVIVDLPMTEHNKDLDDEILYINDASDVDGRFYFHNNNVNTDTGVILSTLTTNDYEFRIKFKLNTVNQFHLFADADGSSTRLIYLSGGSIRLQTSSGSVNFTIPVLTANTTYEMKVKRVGVDSEMILNDVLYAGAEGNNTMLTIDSIIRKWSAVTGVGTIDGIIYGAELWVDGDSTTGTLVLDMPLNEYKSNFVSNLANPLGSNVWDDNSAVLTGDTTELNGQYSMTTATSSVYLDVPSSTGLGYLLTIDLVSGDIQELDGGLSGVQNTGWQNARDAQQQPIPNRYVTLVNNTTNDNLTITKTGSNPIVFNGVSYQRAIDYGVLNGTRGTDYDWTSDSHHAIGYNITTEQECE